ncbi:MAG: hypothetical protein CVU46_01455 [Chloroflexi bacterium HGW-Chloroflexi-8]|jgi:epoxide hydrolase-like predicted phosphatase|nr:MAG: hypothetical protein CVU46_01455 [Chloroflexi bacterium HGW-Chloroflexi-8]
MADQKIKVIIFDMGGVLIKTVDRARRTELAKKFNKSYDEIDKIVYGSDSSQKAMLGEISETDHFMNVLKCLGDPDFGIREFQEAFWGGDELDLELAEFISSKKNQFRFGMLSNAMSDIRKWLTDHYDFLNLFDIVFFSAEYKIAKPDLKFYRAILKEFDVDPNEVIFIDDFVENINAAKSLGMLTVHYHSTKQAIFEINQLLRHD